MDKILAFSILSSSPADIAAPAGFGFSTTRLSWRASSAGTPNHQHQHQHQQQQAEKAPSPRQQDKAAAAKQQAGPPRLAAERKKPRFAPEFDGINCFESIVSF